MSNAQTANRTLKLPSRHPTQQTVFASLARYRVVAKGRRWGGSMLGVIEATAAAYTGGVAWYISRDYSNSYDRWQEIKRLALQIKGTKLSESRFEVVYPSGGVLTVKSAHDPDSLRGAGLDFIVLDEFAYTPKAEYLWRNVISPMLATTNGRALIMSSPNGMGNFFFTMYGYGLDPEMTDWKSFLYTSADNPLVPKDWLESQRSQLPERVYQQEYLSLFLPDGAGVFRGVLDACTAKPQHERIDGHSYILSIDWGRSNDFTVICVMDTTTRTEVQLDRFTNTLYSVQRDRIKALWERWQPDKVWAEANSIGTPNIEALQAEGIPVKPFNTTNATKADAVNSLVLAIERTSQGLDNGVVLLDDPVGIAELQAFEYDTSPSGLIRFGARAGEHDDTVIARAIAVKAMGEKPADNRIWRLKVNPFYGSYRGAQLHDFNHPTTQRSNRVMSATSTDTLEAVDLVKPFTFPDSWKTLQATFDIYLSDVGCTISPNVYFRRIEGDILIVCQRCNEPHKAVRVSKNWNLYCENCKVQEQI